MTMKITVKNLQEQQKINGENKYIPFHFITFNITVMFKSFNSLKLLGYFKLKGKYNCYNLIWMLISKCLYLY